MKFQDFCKIYLPDAPTDLQQHYIEVVDNTLPANTKYFNFDAGGLRGKGLTFIKCLHLAWYLENNQNHEVLFLVPTENAARDTDYKIKSLGVDRDRVTLMSAPRIRYGVAGRRFHHIFTDNYELPLDIKTMLRPILI